MALGRGFFRPEGVFFLGGPVENETSCLLYLTGNLMVFVSDNELSRVVEPLLSKSSRNVPVYNHLSLIMLMDRRDMLISFSQPLN